MFIFLDTNFLEYFGSVHLIFLVVNQSRTGITRSFKLKVIMGAGVGSASDNNRGENIVLRPIRILNVFSTF